MKSNKNNGITLIALVITIIVLLILAGISIQIIVGKNGIVNRAITSSKETAKGKLIEDYSFAYDDIYAQMLEENNQNISDKSLMMDNARKKLISDYGYTEDEIIEVGGVVTDIILSSSEVEIEEEETIDDLTISLVNETEKKYYALIQGEYYEVKLEDSRLVLGETVKGKPTEGTIESPTIEVTQGKDIIEASLNLDKITITGKAGQTGEAEITVKCGSVSKKIKVTVKVKMPENLSELDIGSYVDIEIPYTNVENSFDSSYTETSEKLTGWRILDNTGSEVKLISAGCPLTYSHRIGDVGNSINKLENLCTTITLNGGSSTAGFVKNGFGDNNNLQEVFGGSTYVDTSKGVHAFSCGTIGDGTGTGAINNPLPELETLYRNITGTDKTMLDFYHNITTPFVTSIIKKAAGDGWKDSYSDLLGIGQDYWIGGASFDDILLWLASYNGSQHAGYISKRGVRPVVTLKSDVKIDKSQVRDGKSAETAYKLTR